MISSQEKEYQAKKNHIISSQEKEYYIRSKKEYYIKQIKGILY